MKTVILVIAGLASMVALYFAVGLGPANPSVARDGLWTDVVQRGEMVVDLRVSGTLVPRNVLWLTAQTGGVVVSVPAVAGAQVDSDSVIMTLANPSTEAALIRARALLAQAEADLAGRLSEAATRVLEQKSLVAQAQANYEISRARTKSLEEALVAGAVARVEYEQSRIVLAQNRNLLDIAREREAQLASNASGPVSAAKAQRDAAASALALAEADVRELTVRANIPGIVQMIAVEPGQQVAAGTVLARVASPRPLIARLQVPEVQAKNVELGLPALVNTFSGTVEGTVERIDPAVRNGSVLVDVVFPGELPAGVRPDLSVEGRIIVERLTDALVIKRPNLAAPNSPGTLYVIPAGGSTAVRRTVAFGRASADQIQIDSGVAPGETVILSDMSRWSSYDTINLK